MTDIPPELGAPQPQQGGSLREHLPPNAAKQVDAIIRFAQQRGAGQGGQVVQEQPQI
jgi:hypothetical protein